MKFEDALYKLIQEVKSDITPFSSPEEEHGDDINRITKFSKEWNYKDKYLSVKNKYDALQNTLEIERKTLALKGIHSFSRELILGLDEAYILKESLPDNSLLQQQCDVLIKNLEDILLTREGKVVRPKPGETPNPELHKIVKAQLADSKIDQDVITRVYRNGYVLFGKVIRAAEVEVLCVPRD